MPHKLLTERQRDFWSAVVIALELSTLPTSLSMLAFTVYIRFVVDEELDLVQGMNTAFLPYFLAATGTINFLNNVLFLSTIARAHRPSSREATMRALLVSLVIDLVVTQLVFAACIACFVQMAILPSSFEAGLTKAMQQYSMVPHVKVRMDVLQMEYECCGDQGYQDWFTVPWVPSRILMVDPKVIQADLEEGAKYISDDVPFSCCDPSSPRPCIHHHVTINHLHYHYDHRLNVTLFTAGCRQALMDFFSFMLLRQVALSLLLLFLGQMSIVCMSRLLQTSMQNAINQGDLRAPAVGYLFCPPKDCEKDEEAGGRGFTQQPVLPLGPPPKPPGGAGLGEGTKELQAAEETTTTDTEVDTTTEEPASAPSSLGRGDLLTDLDTTTATEDEVLIANIPSGEEPLYENIPLGEEPLYENIPLGEESLHENIPPESLYDDLDEFSTSQEQARQPGVVLFPSEVSQNSNVNYVYAGWHRRNRSGGSKAFNSLGIPAPHHPAGFAPLTTHHRRRARHGPRNLRF